MRFFVVVKLESAGMRHQVQNKSANGAKVLLIEDDLSAARVYKEYLTDVPYIFIHHSTGTEALDFLSQNSVDVVILDFHLPDVEGVDVLRKIKEIQPLTPVIVVTANGSVSMAVDSMQAGATDFLLKPFNASRLKFTISHVLEKPQLNELVETFDGGQEKDTYCGFVGSSPIMQDIYNSIDRIAPSKATIFITGQSGTGKELAAEAIHRMSPRRTKPFVALNCGAIPEDLMESEIFGHVKGAFTNAISDRDGVAKLADGGTLFLDEICEMDPALQVKLLRFLQTDTFRKVGGTKLETVDVRIICATNRDPHEEVAKGNFREDLFYRLHVVPLHMPPLSKRGNDIIEIARSYLEVFCAAERKVFTDFSDKAQEYLRSYLWPGNVRELRNTIQRAIILHEGPILEAHMLGIKNMPAKETNNISVLHQIGSIMHANMPIPSMAANNDQCNQGDIIIQPMWKVERNMIETAMAHCNNNVQQAAILLEMSPSTLYRRIRELKEQPQSA